MNNRNKPCPCLSGSKYKKCCGSEVKLNEARRAAEAAQLEAIRQRAIERQRKQDELRKSSPGALEYRAGGSRMAMMTLMAVGIALGGRHR